MTPDKKDNTKINKIRKEKAGAKKQKQNKSFLFSAGHHGYLTLHSVSWRMSTHRERRLILAVTSEYRDRLR